MVYDLEQYNYLVPTTPPCSQCDVSNLLCSHQIIFHMEDAYFLNYESNSCDMNELKKKTTEGEHHGTCYVQCALLTLFSDSNNLSSVVFFCQTSLKSWISNSREIHAEVWWEKRSHTNAQPSAIHKIV